MGHQDNCSIKYHQGDMPYHFLFCFRYYFKTESHDISFGVFYKSEGSDQQEEILPVTRRSCHLIPETGVIICDKIGTCKYQGLVSI